MPKARFTKAIVEQFPLSQRGQLLIRDSQLPGFGLRIGSTAKTYFAEGQVNRRTVRATIGRADILSLDVARKKAISLLGHMAEGIDPNRHPAENDTQISLRTAFQEFFAERRHLAEDTVSSYARTQNLYLRDWSDRPLAGITRQMVLTRHQKVAKEHGSVTANNVMRHLRSVYNFTAAKHDEFPPNPVTILTQARSWHREQRRRTFIAPHQLPAWWSAVFNEVEDARDVLLIGLFTGMRRSEIVRLRWEHLDFVGLTLKLPKTKNGDPLHLPLSNFLAEVLAARRELVVRASGCSQVEARRDTSLRRSPSPAVCRPRRV